MVDVLGHYFDTIGPRLHPERNSSLFQNFYCVLSLVNVVQKLSKHADELCIILIIMIKFLRRVSDLVAFVYSLLYFSTFNKHHEFNLLESSDVIGIFYCQAFKFYDGHAVCYVFCSVLGL
jgi:predicted Na+-dependent transporter